MHLDSLTETIIGHAIRVHQRIGPGLLESVYESLLARRLIEHGIAVERQKAIPLVIDGIRYREAFRADLLVGRTVIVELKSRESLAPVHTKQMTTYLRITGLHVGLLINFGAPLLRDGIKRVVNHLPPSESPTLRINQSPERR